MTTDKAFAEEYEISLPRDGRVEGEEEGRPRIDRPIDRVQYGISESLLCNAETAAAVAARRDTASNENGSDRIRTEKERERERERDKLHKNHVTTQ